MRHSSIAGSGLTLTIAAAIASGAALPEPAFGQTVADRALSDVRTEVTGTCTTLTINFNMRIQVLSSFPATGRELQIRIQPLEPMGSKLIRDSLRTPTNLPELRSIEYDGDNAGGPVVSMFFTKDMHFEVDAGQAPQTVVIKVTQPGQACGSGDAAPPAPVVATPEAPPAPAEVVPAGPSLAAPGTEQDRAETAQQIAAAEQAIRDSNPDKAIELLTQAAARTENENTPRAIELLGVTNERKGQTDNARAQYQEYLRRYPTGEGSDRVRQRLASLNTTLPSGQPQQLRDTTKTADASAWKWGLRGSFSQFYFRDQGRTNALNTSSTLGTEVDNSVNVNQLLTNGDITISGGTDKRQFQVRAAGSYTQNFGTSASITTINQGSQTQTYRSKPGGGIEALTALYFDYTDRELGTQLRVGRQTRNTQGVFGRFDGALLGWQATPKLRFNAVSGFPVFSSRQMKVLTDRPFYGASVDIGAKRSPIQTTLYWFDSRAKGGFIDRRSVGIESRFLRKSFNAYAMLDYNINLGDVNMALLSLNYNFPDGSNFSLIGDYRKQPLLGTLNALNQMIDPANNRIETLSGLQPFFTDSEINQLAKDRTLTAKSLTATYSRPITKKLQVSADFSLTDTGGMPGTAATLGTQAIAPTLAVGKEYFYGLQFIGSDLLMTNDIYILSGRYADTSTSRIYTADFNARLPVTDKFRVSPRVRYGFSDDKITLATLNPGTFHQFQPTMRFNYYPVRHSELELEFGGNFQSRTVWNSTSAAYGTIDETGWVVSAGYRLDF